MIEITKKNELENQISSNEKLIVLFYSSWCPFCRRFLPIFNKLSKLENFRFLQVRIDDDENPLWEDLSIEAVPTLFFYTNGKVISRIDSQLGTGLNEMQVRNWLDEAVNL